jgi:hypothetical protein
MLELDYFFTKLKTINPTDPFDPNALFKGNLKAKVLAIHKGNPVKLHLLFKQFYDKFISLAQKRRRDKVIEVYFKMNDLSILNDAKVTRYTVADIHDDIKAEAIMLFNYLYSDILESYDIHGHYQVHYEDTNHSNWCTFCGLETLPHYTDLKADYDHLLAKSIYPFCSVNMRNLVPMGTQCNRNHKKDKDIIYTKGSRTLGFNPYKTRFNIQVEFRGTKLPRPKRRDGEWEMSFYPDNIQVETWSDVFNIKNRIIKEHLTNPGKTDYDTWLGTFIMANKGRNITTIAELKAALKGFSNMYNFDRYKEKRYVIADLFLWISKNGSDTYYNALLRML